MWLTFACWLGQSLSSGVHLAAYVISSAARHEFCPLHFYCSCDGLVSAIPEVSASGSSRIVFFFPKKFALIMPSVTAQSPFVLL